ncbi:MAG: radical SAM protein, partial [Deltaproteobacteria bacterium]|nr:radical SAM protein [Deltaproteobacteria bacterium]
SRTAVREAVGNYEQPDLGGFNAALSWFSGGMRSVFLQDANSLIIKPLNLLDILLHLKKRFPWVERITSYARSHTIARIKDRDLKNMKDAGLNRIHIGLESGSDRVLKIAKKGAQSKKGRDGIVGVYHAGPGWKSLFRDSCPGNGRCLKPDQPGFYKA